MKQDQPATVEEKVEYVSPDGRKRTITHKCILNRLTLDLKTYLSKIKKTKQILLIHGSADTTIPVEDALQLANALPTEKRKVVIIEKASHDLLDTQAIKT
ncbi:alpha beta fold family protein, partial [Cystoisospora suis]